MNIKGEFDVNTMIRVSISLDRHGVAKMVRYQTTNGITSFIVSAKNGYALLEKIYDFLDENHVYQAVKNQ